MTKRFLETAAPLAAFTATTLLVCPACGLCAESRDLGGNDSPGWFNPRRLVCLRCSFSREWAERAISRRARDAVDDFFGLPLWLQTPCCGDVLWAYSEQHLAALESYVLAELRERRRDPAYGWSNRSWISRLPTWIKLAKNRDEVSRGFRRLRERLGRRLQEPERP